MVSPKYAICVAFALAMVAYGGTAAAAVITCDDVDDHERTATVNYDDAQGTLQCGPSGTRGGRHGTPVDHSLDALGFFEIEKLEGSNGTIEGDFFEITGIGGTSGTFTIFDNAADIDDLHIVFVFGFAQISPDWISFQLNGVTHGRWSVSGTQALSNVILVPEPAMLALFGAGLLGLGLARRRRGVISA